MDGIYVLLALLAVMMNNTRGKHSAIFWLSDLYLQEFKKSEGKDIMTRAFISVPNAEIPFKKLTTDTETHLGDALNAI